jgi:cupin 2 domain-containing protein
MNVNISSIFADIPEHFPEELSQTLLSTPSFRIERIVSRGHCSDSGFWFDQPQDEWVILLKGQARLRFFDGRIFELGAGDYLLIPAHCQHSVVWTTPAEESIWLAVHFEKKSNANWNGCG